MWRYLPVYVGFSWISVVVVNSANISFLALHMGQTYGGSSRKQT